MPIQVTCPSCLTRFAVSEKFAGKKGPCPKCKAQIEVPDKTGEVVIHAPADDAPKDSKGRSVLKPIERKETRLTRRQVLMICGAGVLAIAVALGLRLIGDAVHPVIVALGAILIAPPLIWAAYSFAYDQELDPYRGPELRNRVLILSGIFPLLWLVYAYVPVYLLELDRPSEMSMTMAAIMFAVVLTMGTIAAAAAFELETVGGLTVAGAYFVGTLLLAYLAAIPLFGTEPTPRRPASSTPPAATVLVHPPIAAVPDSEAVA